MNTLNNTLDNDQDPEYADSVPSDQSHQKALEENARANATKKIEAIIEKEFSKEIVSKGREVTQIQDQLDSALKTLHLLRYAIVTDYYNRKQCQSKDVKDSKQTRIHPAVKKLIGKSPRFTRIPFLDNAVPSTSKDPCFLDPEAPSTSKAGSDFFEIEKTCENSEKNLKRSHDSCMEELPKKIPRYIPPKSAIPELEDHPPRGNHNKNRKQIIVENTSKFILEAEREIGGPTHIWHVYVKGDEKEPDIGHFVSKVRFFLHLSYRPNDVVDVTSSPFRLSRPGWGEFDLRVQIHFKNILDKPHDIIHPLQLDRTYTGLVTGGIPSSDFVYLQKNEPRLLPSVKSELTQKEVKILKPEDSQLTNFTIKHETETSEKEEEASNLKSLVFADHDYCSTSSKSQIVENNKTVAHLLNGSTESLQNGLSSGKENEEALHLNGLIETDVNINKVNMQKLATTMKDSPGKMQPLKISIPQPFEPQKKKQFLVLKNKEIVPVNFDPMSKVLIDPASIQKKVNSVNNRMQTQSGPMKFQVEKTMHKNNEKSKLLKVNASNSILLTNNYSEPALKIVDFASPQSLEEDHPIENLRLKAGTPNSFKPYSEFKDEYRVEKIIFGKDNAKMSKKEMYEEVMRSIDDVRLTDTLSLVKFIMHRLPLITEDASNPEYKRLHPYTCKSVEEFLTYNIGKQRSYEWQRAKAVRSLLKKKVPEGELWSVKEIIIWARRHAHTPISSITNAEKSSVKTSSSDESILSTATEPVDLHNWLSDSSKNVEGSNWDSDSDEEIDIISEEKPITIKTSTEVEKLNANILLDLPPESESLFTFVNETTRQIGITLRDEEIIPEVQHCASSHVMMQAVQCFVEDIVRLSYAKAIDRCGSKNSMVESINLEDVRGALFKREEFDLFTNAGLGMRPTSED